MSEWSHLANAKHIDRIIAQGKANTMVWNVSTRRWVRGAAEVAAEVAAFKAAYEVAGAAVYDALYDAVHDDDWAAADKAWRAAYDAILALVAWDHASGLMDLPAEQVKVLALLGDQAAILLYPAIEAMETTQELV